MNIGPVARCPFGVISYLRSSSVPDGCLCWVLMLGAGSVIPKDASSLRDARQGMHWADDAPGRNAKSPGTSSPTKDVSTHHLDERRSTACPRGAGAATYAQRIRASDRSTGCSAVRRGAIGSRDSCMHATSSSNAAKKQRSDRQAAHAAGRKFRPSSGIGRRGFRIRAGDGKDDGLGRFDPAKKRRPVAARYAGSDPHGPC